MLRLMRDKTSVLEMAIDMPGMAEIPMSGMMH